MDEHANMSVEYGQREFTVEDPAGNFLTFWSALE
jgi:hypothetical protein